MEGRPREIVREDPEKTSKLRQLQRDTERFQGEIDRLREELEKVSDDLTKKSVNFITLYENNGI